MYEFDYRSATNLDDAASRLGSDEDARLVAGGMTLLPTLKLRLAKPSQLIDLAGIPELKGISEEGDAVVIGAKDRGVAAGSVDAFQAIPGKGARGRVDGVDVAIGNVAMMREAGVEASGSGALLVAAGGKFAGRLVVSDPIKATSAEAIRQLRAEGLRIVMLTGDSRATAETVGKQLGIDEVVAEVLPQDKRIHIQRLQDSGRFVAMAGDGINDAPALAQAQIGIAMGTGADVAMQSADVTLVQGDLRAIVRARRLSRATMSNIKQNLFFALVYNSLGVPIAAGILYPVFGLLLSPMIAAAAMSFSSVSVIANALRLRRVRV